MADPEQDDALIEELLDEALADYEGIVPPEVFAAIRAQIGDTLAATEAGTQLLRQVRPDPVVARSANLEVSRDDAGRPTHATGTAGVARTQPRKKR